MVCATSAVGVLADDLTDYINTFTRHDFTNLSLVLLLVLSEETALDAALLRGTKL